MATAASSAVSPAPSGFCLGSFRLSGFCLVTVRTSAPTCGFRKYNPENIARLLSLEYPSVLGILGCCWNTRFSRPRSCAGLWWLDACISMVAFGCEQKGGSARALNAGSDGTRLPARWCWLSDAPLANLVLWNVHRGSCSLSLAGLYAACRQRTSGACSFVSVVLLQVWFRQACLRVVVFGTEFDWTVFLRAALP